MVELREVTLPVPGGLSEGYRNSGGRRGRMARGWLEGGSLRGMNQLGNESVGQLAKKRIGGYADYFCVMLRVVACFGWRVYDFVKIRFTLAPDSCLVDRMNVCLQFVNLCVQGRNISLEFRLQALARFSDFGLQPFDLRSTLFVYICFGDVGGRSWHVQRDALWWILALYASRSGKVALRKHATVLHRGCCRGVNLKVAVGACDVNPHFSSARRAIRNLTRDRLRYRPCGPVCPRCHGSGGGGWGTGCLIMTGSC